MAIELDKLKAKLIQNIKSKSFVKNLLLGLGIFAIILLLVAILFRDISQERYGVLYSGLSPEDAGKILSVLQEEKIPYKIEGDGSIILVPKDQIYDVRLKLAAKGLPDTPTVGFEIFNEPKMGETHFQENINYLRAIEGELTRTIKKISAVKDAKVNIAMPQNSIFAREEEEAKASVIVSLWPGKDLNPEQVKAIVFLVSHAVPRLKPQNVTVVDNRGRVLSDLIEEKEEKVKDIVDIKRKLKREIEKSVQSMLARALGPQKVVVRANVDVETAKINQEDHLIDPNRVAVVSERKIQEKEKGYAKKPLGAPGTPTNVPATINRTNNELLKDKSKKDITTNFDISKTFIKTEKNLFKIKRITVGVLIDGKYITQEINGTKKVIFEPRSEAEIKAYERLIKSAVGFDETRGDKVTVVSVPFETQRIPITKASKSIWKEYILYAAIAVLVLMLFAFIFILIRIKKRSQQRLQEQLAALQVESSKEETTALESIEHEMESYHLEEEPAFRRILEVIEENPDLVAMMISKWMKEEMK